MRNLERLAQPIIKYLEKEDFTISRSLNYAQGLLDKKVLDREGYVFGYGKDLEEMRPTEFHLRGEKIYNEENAMAHFKLKIREEHLML